MSAWCLNVSIHCRGELVRSVSYSTFPIRIGSQPTNDLVLRDRYVSGQHGEVDLVGEKFRYRDLGSLNGSMVRGRRTREDTIASGDVVEIHPFTLVFEMVPNPKASTARTMHAPFDELASSVAGMRRKSVPTAAVPVQELIGPTPRRAGGLPRPAPASAAVERECLLEVVSGPFPLAGHVFRVTTSPALVGRTEACQVRLDTETVSREHARLVRDDDGHWRLEDLQSLNGTFVGDSPVVAIVLRSGDQVGIGPRVKVRFTEVEPARPGDVRAAVGAAPAGGRLDRAVGPTTAQPLAIICNRVEPHDAVGVVRVVGRVDSLNYADLDQKLRELIDEGRHFLIVDVSAIGFIDHAGLGVLMKFAVRLKDLGGQMRLAGVSERLADTLALTRLDTTVFASRIDADEGAALAEVIHALPNRRPSHA